MVGLDNPLHILLLLVVVLLVFGAKKLPDMGRGLGEGMRSFKSGISGEAPHEPVGLSSAPEPVSLHTMPQAVATPAAERESAPVA